jgi:hypothetical protein
MGATQQELEEIGVELGFLEHTLSTLVSAAKLDGTIDDDEQDVIDDLEQSIRASKRKRDELQAELAGAAGSGSAKSSAGSVSPANAPRNYTLARIVPGGGGYTYAQWPDGELAILQGPQGQKDLPVKRGATAWKAITAEIGTYSGTGDSDDEKIVNDDEDTTSIADDEEPYELLERALESLDRALGRMYDRGSSGKHDELVDEGNSLHDEYPQVVNHVGQNSDILDDVASDYLSRIKSVCDRIYATDIDDERKVWEANVAERAQILESMRDVPDYENWRARYDAIEGKATAFLFAEANAAWNSFLPDFRSYCLELAEGLVPKGGSSETAPSESNPLTKDQAKALGLREWVQGFAVALSLLTGHGETRPAGQTREDAEHLEKAGHERKRRGKGKKGGGGGGGGGGGTGGGKGGGGGTRGIAGKGGGSTFRGGRGGGSAILVQLSWEVGYAAGREVAEAAGEEAFHKGATEKTYMSDEEFERRMREANPLPFLPDNWPSWFEWR